jgi:hypothetical protein
MVVLALIFESIHKKIHHHLQHHTALTAKQRSIDLSKMDIIMKGHTRGLYMLRLMERGSGELMVLGFIAFVVWGCNKGEVYEKVLDPEGRYGPQSAADLLHTVEDVHMQLFMAMVRCNLHS